MDNKFYIMDNCNNLMNINFIDYLKKVQNNGAGEIILNSVDDDGSMKGYNFEILNSFLKHINVPSIFLGGWSSLENIKNLFDSFENIAAGCSSLFIYKGKFRAVLISYPSELERLKY